MHTGEEYSGFDFIMTLEVFQQSSEVKTWVEAISWLAYWERLSWIFFSLITCAFMWCMPWAGLNRKYWACSDMILHAHSLWSIRNSQLSAGIYKLRLSHKPCPITSMNRQRLKNRWARQKFSPLRRSNRHCPLQNDTGETEELWVYFHLCLQWELQDL